MIKLSANITYTGLTPDLTAKEWNGVKRESYRQMGEHFWRVNLPRRFTWAGGRLLGFPRRSEKYNRKKMAKFGHRKPNVYTGASEKLATTIRDVRSVATRSKTRASIILHARGLNRSNPKSKNRVRTSEDVRRISAREVPPLARFLAKRIQENFKHVPFNLRRDNIF